MAINAQELQGQWNRLRGQVREHWGQLTDDDLQMQGGNVDQLVGRIQQKTGETREVIERYLNDLTARGGTAHGFSAWYAFIMRPDILGTMILTALVTIGYGMWQQGGRPR